MHAFIQHRECYLPHFSIIMASICPNHRFRQIHPHDIPEIHPMLGEIADPLALVPLELHTPIVCTIGLAGKP